MNFQQLRIIREAVRRGLNLTEVAAALHTSQSGVSKHIKDLEDELGVELFVRRGKRLVELTQPGRELVTIAERMLIDAANIKRLAEQFASADRGELVIATTHTQARYALPRVVAEFKASFPDVHLVLHQASPEQIAQMLLDDAADIGIATEFLVVPPELAAFPYYTWSHAIVAPTGHALTLIERPSLEELADHPIITYHEGFTGRSHIDDAFTNAGSIPDIVMSALDADVIKSYVELGLGIGIIASMAFDSARDRGLELVAADHLFSPNTARIAVHRGRYLRGYAYRFIELCASDLTESVVRAASNSQPESAISS